MAAFISFTLNLQEILLFFLFSSYFHGNLFIYDLQKSWGMGQRGALGTGWTVPFTLDNLNLSEQNGLVQPFSKVPL